MGLAARAVAGAGVTPGAEVEVGEAEGCPSEGAVAAVARPMELAVAEVRR